jgi:hypothetical protein
MVQLLKINSTRLMIQSHIYVGVYAKISAQLGWIRNTICSDHSSPSPDYCSDSETDPIDVPIDECTDFSWFDSYGDDCSW